MSRVGLLEDRATRRKHGLPAELRLPQLEDLSATTRNEIDASWSTATSPFRPALIRPRLRRGERSPTWWKKGAAPRVSCRTLRSSPSSRSNRRDMPNGTASISASISASIITRTSLECRAHARRACRRAGLLPGSFRAVSIRPGTHHRVSRLREICAVVRKYDSVSEAVGFVADLTSGEGIDYVTYVTAHELAHQWWAHQVIGAQMQGGTLFTERSPRLRAYGHEKALRREQDAAVPEVRAGSLSHWPWSEPVEELPLVRVENQPSSITRKARLSCISCRSGWARRRSIARCVR